MILQIPIVERYICLMCLNWLHAGHACSSVEKHRAIPVVRMVLGRDPH
jgi:hypothetical protein